MTTTFAAPVDEPTVDITPAACPLTAQQCTVEKCYYLNDEKAQADCKIC